VTPEAAPALGQGTWGILGGTFDPIHLAHLAIAEQSRDALGLSGVLFLPAGLPPHKTDRVITPSRHRLAMVEAAIGDNPTFHLSRMEVDRDGPSFAVDTLESLQADIPEAARRLIWILSAEALRGFVTWRRPERILELCRLAVVPRLGYRSPGRSWLAEHFPDQEDRIIFLDGPELGDSASRIRQLVGEGRSIRYLVPDAVARYINDHHLYPPELWAKNRGGT